MNIKYEKLFFEFLYNKMGLSEFESRLVKDNVKPYAGLTEIPGLISKYFVLISQGSFDRFTEEEKAYLEGIKEGDDVSEFLMNTYKKYFFDDSEFRYIYYGPSTYEYAAPSDSIVLGLYYTEFDFENNSNDEFLNNGVVVDVANDIQDKSNETGEFKVAVITYNEVALSQPFVRL